MKLPPQFIKSYVLLAPRDTTVIAACSEVGCQHWAHGWDSVIDERTLLGKSQADYIRTRSGRTFRELGAPESGVTVFRFEPFQRCFREHRTNPVQYVVRGGDWRGNPRHEGRLHKTAADWQEDSALHQQRIAQAIERG